MTTDNLPPSQRRQAGYLAKNPLVNRLAVILGAVWAYLEYLSGSLVWFACALLLISLSVLNLVAMKKIGNKSK